MQKHYTSNFYDLLKLTKGKIKDSLQWKKNHKKFCKGIFYVLSVSALIVQIYKFCCK